MRKRRDPIEVVEAAYDLRAPEPLWLERLVEAARPLLDDGCGVMGMVVDLSGDGPHARAPVGLGGTPEWRLRWRQDWYERVIEPMPRELLARLLSFGPVTYGSIAGRAAAQGIDTMGEYLEVLAARGIRGEVFGHTVPERGAPRGISYPEALIVTAIDASGHGVGIGGSRASIAKRPPTRLELRTWTRVAAHIGAAHRIRRRLLGGAPLDGAEAVVTPRGRVVHAEGQALAPRTLEGLRRTALEIDRARTTRARASDDPLDLWRALHDGRWSLVDTFDSDGRRFLIARANEPATDPAPALSRREQQVLDLLSLGHSNKLIAYDLGISVSSVATHLRRAGAKLRLQTTRDLVRWARARARPVDGP